MADIDELHAKVLAQAIYEIRLLLGDYLDEETGVDPEVRQAAHLAYALHNEALQVLSGGSFDIPASLARLEAVDLKLGSSFREGFVEILGDDPGTASDPSS